MELDSSKTGGAVPKSIRFQIEIEIGTIDFSRFVVFWPAEVQPREARRPGATITIVRFAIFPFSDASPDEISLVWVGRFPR